MHRAKAAFNEQHVELFNAINDHAARLAEAEGQVRTLTLAAYEMDPTSRKPAPGAEVVMRTTYSYDPQDAMAWAEVSPPTAILTTLDRKAVDKIAATGLLPFATKIETPSVRLAADLSDYLPVTAGEAL